MGALKESINTRDKIPPQLISVICSEFEIRTSFFLKEALTYAKLEGAARGWVYPSLVQIQWGSHKMKTTSHE